jgi:hypothetical protein
VQLLVREPRIVRQKTPARAEAAASIVHEIKPTTVYSLPAAQQALGLSRTCLFRERRRGRLRVAKRGGAYLVLGSWLLAWLEAGEDKSRARTQQVS